MILKKIRNKLVNSSRARRFKIANVNKMFCNKFKHIQYVNCLYFNYGLKYLYQHYGVTHLSSYFPSGVERKYLINKLVKFARKRTIMPDFNLKKQDYGVQSVDKMLENLCVNMIKYRKGQYKCKYYWSNKEIKRYLKKHNCNLTGYGRINFKHHLNEIKSVTFKQNHNRIRLINNYIIKIPYFGKIRTKQSLSFLKHKKIKEVRIKMRKNGDFELQALIKFRKQKHITKQQAKNIQGLDVNSANNKFFALSNKKVISWPLNVKQKYLSYDIKARNLQNYITNHNNGNDNSRKTKDIKKQLSKVKAKCTYMIDNWYLHIAKSFAILYPVMAMERLKAFTMRISKRDKRYYLRKNTNHKLQTIHPTKFRKIMEDIYQDMNCLLLEVNPAYTSKTCHNDGHINFKLKLQKRWLCNFCKKIINRDLNATYNIRDWAVNPKQHALWRLHCKNPKKFPNVKLQDLVTTF